MESVYVGQCITHSSKYFKFCNKLEEILMQKLPCGADSGTRVRVSTAQLSADD